MHQNGATFTVLSWYQCDNFSSQTNLIGTEQVSGSESGFLFALRMDRKWDIFIGQTNSDMVNFNDSVQTPNDTDWHMLMVQYNDATGTVSVSIDNGTVATSTGHNLTNTSNQANYFIMGADGATNESWEGRLDETSIWNRVLTSAEITTIYNSGTGKTLDTAKGAGTWTYENTSLVPTVSGLKLHLDASDSTTITKDSSNLVSAWNDKSGQANHVVQATGSKQPLWVDRVQDTLPTIRFDGTDDSIRRGTFVNGALTQPTTVFIVCKMGGASTPTQVVYDSGVGANRHVFYTYTSGTHGFYAGIELTGGGIVDTTKNLLYTQLFNTTSSTLRKSKIQINSGSVGTFTWNGITLGASTSGTGNPFTGDICEILVYNANVSDTDRDNIEQYLTKKWGL